MLAFTAIENNQNQMACGICSKQPDRILVHDEKAAHGFCNPCAREWAVNADTCAICRAEIDIASILSPKEISESADHRFAVRLAANEEMENADRQVAIDIQEDMQREIAVLPVAHVLHQEANDRYLVPCIAATGFVVALVAGAILNELVL